MTGDAKFVYKCRRCGKLKDPYGVANEYGLEYLSRTLLGLDTPDFRIPLTVICNCNDGNLGVADLIGVEYEKSEGI